VPRRSARNSAAGSRVSQVRTRQRKDGPDGSQVTTTEARQGTGPRAMFYVLIASLTLAVIAGIGLGLGWVSLPWTGTP